MPRYIESNLDAGQPHRHMGQPIKQAEQPQWLEQHEPLLQQPSEQAPPSIRYAMRRVVVTGLGLVTPLGLGLPSLVVIVDLHQLTHAQASAAHGRASLMDIVALCPSRTEVPSSIFYQVRLQAWFQRVGKRMGNGMRKNF
jgi:hypothetical protein